MATSCEVGDNLVLMPKRVVGGRFYRGTNSSVRCKDSSSESMSKLILKSMIFVRILERG
jgi:hypothetical protein